MSLSARQFMEAKVIKEGVDDQSEYDSYAEWSLVSVPPEALRSFWHVRRRSDILAAIMFLVVRLWQFSGHIADTTKDDDVDGVASDEGDDDSDREAKPTTPKVKPPLKVLHLLKDDLYFCDD